MNNSLPRSRTPEFMRDMFRDSQYYECNPWFDCLDEEFGESRLYQGSQLSKWMSMSKRERGLWLTGQLWNDTGIMPSMLCSELDIAPGSTYAQGVRRLRQESWRDLQPRSCR